MRDFNLTKKKTWEYTLTHAVGLRTYQIFVTHGRDLGYVAPESEELQVSLPDIISRFISASSGANTVDEQEKTWSVSETDASGKGNSVGRIAYGRYGYAATLKDIGTGETTYRRSKNESEELNLYYRFWLPEGEKFILAAFESFSGKSCISLVFDALRKHFAAHNPDFVLRIRRLMPTGASEAVYAGKPVKNLTLVSRKPPNDIADQLFAGKAQNTRRMSVTFHSARNASLGTFADLMSGLPQDASGVIMHEGVEFDQAVAHVRIGKEIKPVGVFGPSSDVGVIDITEFVEKDGEGLPIFGSVDTEAIKVLHSLYETLHGHQNEN